MRHHIEAGNLEIAAERTAEVILSQCLLGNGRRGVIVEPAIGVQGVIAEIVKQRPVVLIRAGARNDFELTARRAAIFCRVSGSHRAKFLHDVD